MIAKIAVAAATFAIDKPYSYYIPESMQLQPGIRVQVGFGPGNRRTEGVVLAVEPGSADGLKPVDSCLDDTPLLTQQMLRLAAFMRERYFCTYYEAVRAMLPVFLGFTEKTQVQLTQDRSWKDKKLRKENAPEVLKLLEDLGGQAEERILRQAVPDAAALEDVLRYLQKNQWIASQTDFRKKANDKTERIATLAASMEEVQEFIHRRPAIGAMQRAVLELLCSLQTASVKDLCYYTGASAATVKRLEELGYVNLPQREVLRCREVKPAEVKGPLELNAEQEAVFAGISRQMDREVPGAALLYGVTGSGKTAVYLKLIRRTLDAGKSTMLLVPEIALTPQLLSLLAGHFGQQVAVLHSSLPAGERYDQWKRIRKAEAKVVVGTRSAVFAPTTDLGLLILDEEQEHSYKSENSPRYDARQIALWRGLKEQALVLLGSATPSVETMYRAKNGQLQLYTIRNRYNGRALPRVEIVDMRREIKEGNDLSLSMDLCRELQQTRDAGHQAILFLNRRGNARQLQCVQCGQAPQCPRCSASMTYHSANNRLMCHYCGHSQAVPRRCPSCDGQLKPMGVGTQKVQQELQSLFPEMEISRMDADTVSAANTHEEILEHFSQNNVPVLLGTQMVAKGLDMANVTLVGVLDADLSLYNNSYRAAETTFNMLTQVVGRAGRGEASGQAMIQTLVPEHQVLKLAAQQDYDSFYELEIGLRRLLNNPPFADLTQITFIGQEETAVLRGAVKFRDSLAAILKTSDYSEKNAHVLGPAPCPVPKINYNFRYRLTLRCSLDKQLRQLLASLMQQFARDKANRGVSCFVDVNGYE